MFENILIPISSEFYPKQILKRSSVLAKKFNSKLTFLYIIEDKALEKTDQLVDSYLSDYEITQTKKQIIKAKKIAADEIVFNDAKEFFKDKKIKITEKVKKGEFTPIIFKELRKEKYDLILMGFEKECHLKYRLLDQVDIPVWIEARSDSKKILAVTSNLTPNEKVTKMSMKLSKKFGWSLDMLYVIDKEDTTEVDEEGKRSSKKTEDDLVLIGNIFLKKIEKKGIRIKMIKGKIEKETIKTAEEINANLVVIGKEEKKKGLLGLPVKNVKQKIAGKCEYSILFVN